jgi:hypothetical protein
MHPASTLIQLIKKTQKNIFSCVLKDMQETNMFFDTEVNEIPCVCNVINFVESETMRFTGSDFGDFEAPEPGEFCFELLNPSDKTRLLELEEQVSSEDMERLQMQHEMELEEMRTEALIDSRFN